MYLSSLWLTVKMEPGKSVAVFGLGALGLSVIQAAKKAGATDIVGVDVNDGKFEIAKVFFQQFANYHIIQQVPLSRAWVHPGCLMNGFQFEKSIGYS